MVLRLRVGLLFAAVLALGMSWSGTAQSTTLVVPARWRAAVRGCWRLGGRYTADFVAHGREGLTAVQRGPGPTGTARRDEPVQYDPVNDVIGFRAIGTHHAAMLRLELRGGQLRYVFSISRDGTHWADRLPEVATRCAP